MFTDVYTQSADAVPRRFTADLVHLDSTPVFMFDILGGEATIELPMSQADMLALCKGHVVDFGTNNGVEIMIHGLYIH